MTQTVALVTNLTQYPGPAGSAALAAEGYRTICHGYTFTDAAARDAFAAANPGLTPVGDQEPAAIVAAAQAHGPVEAGARTGLVLTAGLRARAHPLDDGAVIVRVLGECDGSKPAAAGRLGISRVTLYHRLRRYRIGVPGSQQQ